MHLSRVLRSTLIGLATAFASQAWATPILYYTPSLVNNGLGQPASSQFTQSVVSAFGAGNVVQIASFNNVADFDDGSALFVNARLGADTLSLQERTNLLNFANAGGAVFFIGDHLSWSGWDNSFLNLFGDSFLAWNGVNAALATNALPGFIAANTQIALSAPGAITGGNGTALFTSFANGQGRSMASLYGPSDNVMAFLDTNAFGNNNAALYSGLSSWLYTTASAYEQSQQNPGSSVPDAASALAFAPLVFGVVLFRRRLGRGAFAGS